MPPTPFCEFSTRTQHTKLTSTKTTLERVMTAKQIIYREDARDRIRRGVDALADVVKVTLGPRGRTVIIGREGAISIEDGCGMVSELEIVEGRQFDRGYL
jgi:chaperonin GroEL (HSP60 family)